MYSHKIVLILVTLFTMLNVGIAQAQVAGKNVIAVHGLDTPSFGKPFYTPQELSVLGEQLTSDNPFVAQFVDANIGWDAKERLDGGIAEDLKYQIAELAKRNFCDDGCFIVSTSAGDLVTRFLLNRQEAWLRPLGLKPLNIIATIDSGGAGGGTNLANLTYDVAAGRIPFSSFLRNAMADLIYGGIELTEDTVGINGDLRIRVARAIPSLVPVPRLRVVGGATLQQTYGITSLILKGGDDGAVAMHSACGASSSRSIYSCSNKIAPDGRIRRTKGPKGLMKFHYPVIMSAGHNHETLLLGGKGHLMATVDNKESDKLDFDIKKRSKGWWIFKKKYENIKNSDKFSAAEIMYEALNN